MEEYMNERHMQEIVEQYSQQVNSDFGDVKVTRIPDHKTVYVETIGQDGRAILMNQYKIDGVTYWAGYSYRSQTVYISLAA
jgi:hypothetical protein